MSDDEFPKDARYIFDGQPVTVKYGGRTANGRFVTVQFEDGSTLAVDADHLQSEDT